MNMNYDRVTQIIEWLAQLWRIDAKYLEERASVGSCVHEGIEAKIKGQFFPVDEEVENYLSSFERWYSLVNLEVIEQEKRYYDEKKKVTGQIDLLVRMGDKKKIVDFKTSSSSHLKTWRLQAAFYFYLVSLQEKDIDNEVLFVRLKKDGSDPKVEKITVTNDLLDLMESVLQIYRYMK